MSQVSRSLVTADFLAEAPELRSTFVERFARQRTHDERSFVWDYWHVPGQYTYFRTFGERYFRDELSATLMTRLRAWGTEVLGCGAVTAPWLSGYTARHARTSRGTSAAWMSSPYARER